MARQTTVTMVDDITGQPGEDVKSVDFSIDGKAREIDLSAESAAAFRDLLAPYVAASRTATVSAPRPTGGRRSGSKSVSPDQARNRNARAWARSQGITVAERGRMNADVLAQWEAAGSPVVESAEQAEPVAHEVTVSDDGATTAPKPRKRRAAATTPTRPDATPDEAAAPADLSALDEFSAAPSA